MQVNRRYGVYTYLLERTVETGEGMPSRSSSPLTYVRTAHELLFLLLGVGRLADPRLLCRRLTIDI